MIIIINLIFLTPDFSWDTISATNRIWLERPIKEICMQLKIIKLQQISRC